MCHLAPHNLRIFPISFARHDGLRQLSLQWPLLCKLSLFFCLFVNPLQCCIQCNKHNGNDKCQTELQCSNTRAHLGPTTTVFLFVSPRDKWPDSIRRAKILWARGRACWQVPCSLWATHLYVLPRNSESDGISYLNYRARWAIPIVSTMAIDVQAAAILFACLSKGKMAWFHQVHKDTMRNKMGTAPSSTIS